MSARDGVTLVELVVVIAILGIAAGVAGIAFRAPAAPARTVSAAESRIAVARRTALSSGRAVTISLPLDSGELASATAYPDGRVVADPALGVNELTGVVDGRAR